MRIYATKAQLLDRRQGLTSPRWDPGLIEPRGPYGLLSGIELPETLRGFGWGRKLEQAVLQGAAREGARLVYTESLLEATDFHEAMGFELVETGVGTDLMVWRP